MRFFLYLTAICFLLCSCQLKNRPNNIEMTPIHYFMPDPLSIRVSEFEERDILDISNSPCKVDLSILDLPLDQHPQGYSGIIGNKSQAEKLKANDGKFSVKQGFYSAFFDFNCDSGVDIDKLNIYIDRKDYIDGLRYSYSKYSVLGNNGLGNKTSKQIEQFQQMLACQYAKFTIPHHAIFTLSNGDAYELKFSIEFDNNESCKFIYNNTGWSPVEPY